MRTLHRILSVLACAVFLYLGFTGSWIQLLDLREILSRAPESSPVMQSINEGKDGNPDYAVTSLGDYTAAPLPQGVDIHAAFAKALQGLHTLRPGEQPAFVELRMANGVLIGQARYGRSAHAPLAFAPPVQAVDVATGAPATGVFTFPIYPRPSLRQTLKEWHRFWTRRDVPGVWFELLAGVALWVLLVSGLILYFRLLAQRRKLERPQLFWMTKDWLRSLHRIVSVACAILLIWVAFTGTWLGFESVWHSLQPRQRPHEAPGLSDAQVLQMADGTAAALRASGMQAPIKVLRVRDYWGMPQGVVVTGGAKTRQLVFDTASGRPAGLTEPNYPNSGFPFGLATHELIKHLHSGFLFGVWARLFDLLAGLALIFLSASGLVMYLQMYGRRLKNGRWAPLWN